MLSLASTATLRFRRRTSPEDSASDEMTRVRAVTGRNIRGAAILARMARSTRGVLLLFGLGCISLACGGGRKGSIDASGGVDVGGSAAGGTLGGGGDGSVASGGAGAGGAIPGTSATSTVAAGGTGTGGIATGTGGIGAGGKTIAPSVTGGAGDGVRTGGTTTGTWAAGGVGAGGAATGTAGVGGTPADARLELDGARMDFGFVAPGTTSVGTFTLTNRGGATSGKPVVSISVVRTPADSATPLMVTGCTAALPANASCVLTIRVTPPMLGLFDAFVYVSADPGTEPHGLPIYVVGWAVGFAVSSPTRIELGDLAPGAEVKRSITLTATSPLSDLRVWTAGSDLSLDTAATTCTATLAQGASCVVAATFVASTLGWKRDIIGASAGGDFGQIVNIEITANVTRASDLAIVPKDPPHFACVFQQTSPPVVFTVTNLSDTASGPIDATVVAADSDGVGAGDLAISRSDCTVLAPHASCTLSVVCAPAMSASSETREAVLSVGDGNSHLAVPLTGDVSY